MSTHLPFAEVLCLMLSCAASGILFTDNSQKANVMAFPQFTGTDTRTTLGEKGLGAREGPCVRRIQWDIAARFPVRKLMTYSQTAKIR
jgi:hypothetical protein